MDTRLLVLKLFLESLSIPATIETFSDRKLVQKAVYLGQLTGVDLGYRFGWYVKGPYSPALTRDYYALSEESPSLEGDRGKELHRAAYQQLQHIVPLLAVPDHLNLSQDDWLELVSSYHYLRHVRRASHSEAVDVLSREKPQLAPFSDTARDQLARVDLPQALN